MNRVILILSLSTFFVVQVRANDALRGSWVKQNTRQEDHAYPGDTNWHLEVTFQADGRFMWKSARRNGADTVDESVAGTYSVDRGLITYLFDKPSSAARMRLPEWFAFRPSKLTGKQTWRIEDGALTLGHDGEKLWFSFERKPIQYFVCDTSVAGDVYTTALAPAEVGRNPTQSLRSLEKVLDRYELAVPQHTIRIAEEENQEDRVVSVKSPPLFALHDQTFRNSRESYSAKLYGRIKLGLMNKEGVQVMAPKVDHIDVVQIPYGVRGFRDCPLGRLRFSNDLTRFQANGRWGFLDGTGQIAIGAMYEDARPFLKSWGLAPVKQNGEWTFVDRQGRRKLDGVFDFVAENIILPMREVHEFARGPVAMGSEALLEVGVKGQRFYIREDGSKVSRQHAGGRTRLVEQVCDQSPIDRIRSGDRFVHGIGSITSSGFPHESPVGLERHLEVPIRIAGIGMIFLPRILLHPGTTQRIIRSHLNDKKSG